MPRYWIVCPFCSQIPPPTIKGSPRRKRWLREHIDNEHPCAERPATPKPPMWWLRKSIEEKPATPKPPAKPKPVTGWVN